MERSGEGGPRRQASARAPAVWGAGIVNHGSYADLERCLASLARQSLPASRVVVYDTGVDPARFEQVCRRHPEAIALAGANVGYAGGANRVLDRLRADRPDALDFALVLNPDVELDPDFARCLLEATSRDPRVAIATGKLLRADRETLDSAGIVFPRHRRPRDRGSEQPDRGQFDAAERVEGASGAAMLLRTAALDTLEIEGEIFDESFFAYHEDTDLCWRARRLGFEILYEPAAVAVHARGWKRVDRGRIPVEIRRHSFKNHYLQVVKNESRADFVRNLPWLIGWEVLRFGFVLARDRALLSGYRDAFRALPAARRRRRLISRRARLLREGRAR